MSLDDESRRRLFDDFLQAAARDRDDGMTTRALFAAFDEHRRDDKANFEKINEKLNETRIDVAHTEGYLDAKTLNGNKSHKPPFWQRIVEKPLVMLLTTLAISLATIAAHALIRMR